MRKCLSAEVMVEDKVNPAVLEITRDEEVTRWEDIIVWRSASISVWMLTGLIILIQENTEDQQGQNVIEEEFNEWVQGQMKSAQHWNEC